MSGVCEYYIFIYIFIYLFIYVFIYLFIHLFIQIFIYLFIYSFMHSVSHSFIHPFLHSCIPSFIHSAKRPVPPTLCNCARITHTFRCSNTTAQSRRVTKNATSSLWCWKRPSPYGAFSLLAYIFNCHCWNQAERLRYIIQTIQLPSYRKNTSQLSYVRLPH